MPALGSEVSALEASLAMSAVVAPKKTKMVVVLVIGPPVPCRRIWSAADKLGLMDLTRA